MPDFAALNTRFPNVDKSRILMVGDRIQTDILLAKKGKLQPLYSNGRR